MEAEQAAKKPAAAEAAPAVPVVEPNALQRRMGIRNPRVKDDRLLQNIGAARDAAVYEAGGLATDLTGSPAVGALVNTATDVATDPLTYAGAAVGRALAPLAKSGGERLMQIALKPSKAARKSGDAEKAVETLLEKGYNVSAGGVEKMTKAIDDLDDALDAVIKGSSAKVNTIDAMKPLKNAVEKFKNGTDQAENLAIIREEASKFFNHPDVKRQMLIPVETAQRIKRGLYAEIGDKGYGMGVKPAAKQQAKKDIARGLNEGIADVEPAAAVINAEMSPLINARNLAQERVSAAGNNNLFGLGVINPKTLLLSLADRSPLVASLAARFLHNAVAPSAGILGTTAGASAGILDQ